MPKVSLRSFDLKLLALLFMLIDHIGAYFPAAPEWFRWLGRIAFPLFLFCLVWSYHYPQPLAFSVAFVSDEPVYGGPALVAGKPLANGGGLWQS